MTTSLIKKACNNLGLNYQDIDDAGVFVKVDLGSEKFHYFIANNLGLNDEFVAKLCRDKNYTQSLLSKYIKMPKTMSYIDSNPPTIFDGFSLFKSHQEIIQDICKKHNFPLVLKPNRKERGINVFLCKNHFEVANAVKQIFNKNSIDYDHVLLVQEKINIHKEFRVLVYKGKIQFVYQKDNSAIDSEFNGNISPLHFINAKAVLLNENKDQKILKDISNFIRPIFKHLKLIYGGLDIVQNEFGEFQLLEINSKPGFSYFVKDNGETKVVSMFEKIIKDLL